MSRDQTIRIPRLLVLLGFFAFGCAAALGQVLLLREFLVTFHGTEICVGAFYGAWFLWIAIGAWWGPRLLQRLVSDAVAYMTLHLAFPLAVLAEIVLLRTLRPVLGVAPDVLLPLETLLLSAFVLTAPVGAIIGALFPVTGKLLAGHGRDPISLGYAWESAGSLAGGVAFTYLLATRFDPLVTLAATGVLEGITVLVVAYGAQSRRAMLVAALGCIAYGSLFTPVGTALDGATERVRWDSLQRGYELVAVRHTPYSHVAVGRDPSGQYALFFDGIQRMVFPDPARYRQEAALAMSQHPAARRVLLLSGGAEGLVQQLLTYPVERIDCVEDDPWALALVRRYLPAADRRALSDRRLRIITQDGRLFVNHRANGQRYDLVISRASHPTTAAQNRYFTREFFERVRRILRPGGAFVLRTVDTEDYVGQHVRRTAASVLHTLRAVFPQVTVVSQHGNLFAAALATGRVSHDPAVLAKRIRATGIPHADVLAAAIRGSVSQERSHTLDAQLTTTAVALNTDARPTTYFHAIQLWGRRSGSELPDVFAALERAGVWLFVVILLVLGLTRLAYRLVVPNPDRSRRTNTALAIGVTGFAAMSLQVMLLMGFQSHLGSLYQKVGLLNGAFMMGLAAGALGGRFLAGRLPAPRLQLAVALGALGLFSLVTPATMAWAGIHGNGMVAAIYFGLSGLAGVVTGGLFPTSVATYDPGDCDVGRTAAVMDAADHVGACLGGLLAGTLIVPIAGQQVTAQVVALAALVPALLLVLDVVLSRMGWRQEPVSPRRLSFPWIRASWVMAGVLIAVLACATLVRCRPPPDDPATVRKPFPHRPYYESHSPAPPPKTPSSQPPPEGPRPGKTGSGRRLQAVGFETRYVAGDIRGYGGPINLWVRFDARGTLQEVILRSHHETPAYVRGVPKWLRLFEEYPLRRPFGGPRGVDVLSGATVTCEAIQSILERARDRAARDLLGLAPPHPPPARPSLAARLFSTSRSWLVLAGLGVVLLASLWGDGRARLVVLGLSAACFGFWWNVPFSLPDVASLGLGQLPGGGDKGVLVLGVIALGLCFGPIWCGYGCPFGALQELVWVAVHPRGRWSSEGLGGARQLSSELEMRARYLKYGLAVLVLCFFYLSGDSAYLALDPMAVVFTRHIPAAIVWLLVILGLASLWLYRPFCRYLCPTGALLALTNKVRLLERLAPRRPVARCDLGVTSTRHVDCLRCHRCLATARPEDDSVPVSPPSA